MHTFLRTKVILTNCRLRNIKGTLSRTGRFHRHNILQRQAAQSPTPYSCAMSMRIARVNHSRRCRQLAEAGSRPGAQVRRSHPLQHEPPSMMRRPTQRVMQQRTQTMAMLMIVMTVAAVTIAMTRMTRQIRSQRHGSVFQIGNALTRLLPASMLWLLLRNCQFLLQVKVAAEYPLWMTRGSKSRHETQGGARRRHRQVILRLHRHQAMGSRHRLPELLPRLRLSRAQTNDCESSPVSQLR
jgi:hypothetical protein